MSDVSKKLQISKSMRDDVHATVMNTDDGDLDTLFEFNLKVLGELNIHTASYRYRYSYALCDTIAKYSDNIMDECDNITHARLEYQTEHGLIFHDGKIKTKNETAKVKDKAPTKKSDISVNVGLDMGV